MSASPPAPAASIRLKFGLVGCGLIGRKRAEALGEHSLAVCVDADLARAEALAAEHPGCLASADLRRVLDSDLDAAIVATTHDALASTTHQLIEAGKHVLVEKPAARTPSELRPVLDALQHRPGLVVKVGFNHRFHPALARAYDLFASGALGDLMYIRARYGHGGRPGYEREWRANPTLSGGGELLDQGSHLIDLSRWFAGDFSQASGQLTSSFWPMPVEDNAFLLLRTERGQVAWLHASWSEWKNLFSFEVFGRGGKLQVDGLGGSYGTERLTYYRMLPEMGPPETTAWEFPGPDTSWRAELAHFAECIQTKTQPCGSLHDALASLEIVADLYRQASRDHHP